MEDKDDKKSKNETAGTPGTASPLGMSPCFLAERLGGCYSGVENSALKSKPSETGFA